MNRLTPLECRAWTALPIFVAATVAGLHGPDVDYVPLMATSEPDRCVTVAALTILVLTAAAYCVAWIPGPAGANFPRRAVATVRPEDLQAVRRGHLTLLFLVLIPAVFSAPAHMQRLLG